MTEALIEKTVTHKLSISTKDNIELDELSNFFNGLDNIYRLTFLFESLEVKPENLQMIASLYKEIPSIKKKMLESRYNSYSQITNDVDFFLEKNYDFNLSFTDKENIEKVFHKQYMHLFDFSVAADIFLFLPFKRCLLNKGLRFKEDVWHNLPETNQLRLKALIKNNGYFEINQFKINEITNILSGHLKIKRLQYNSPGSFDFLGIGKILEVIKDFILELRKEKNRKVKSELEDILMIEKINEQRITNSSKALDNIEKLINLKKKSIELDDKNIKALIDFVDINGNSINRMTDKITKIEIKQENE